jgi:hypothetical protein
MTSQPGHLLKRARFFMQKLTVRLTLSADAIKYF